MEMADNPKLDMASSGQACGLEEFTSTEKITLLDHLNGFQYNATTKKSDNFVIDMDAYSHGVDKDISANSRITMQRSLSKKGFQRSGGGGCGEKKTNPIANDCNSIVATSSPRGSGTLEKPVVASVGTTGHSNSPQPHHQITITTGNIIAAPESRTAIKRNSFKRSSSTSRVLDPKRVLFFFATLSSIGTILLIYFTLSMKYRADESTFD